MLEDLGYNFSKEFELFDFKSCGLYHIMTFILRERTVKITNVHEVSISKLIDLYFIDKSVLAFVLKE